MEPDDDPEDPNEAVLDALLQRAATEPADRPEFIARLLEADVYVLGRMHGSTGPGERVAGEGEKMDIRSWSSEDGEAILPFFTSLAVLREAIEWEESYVRLPARTFFEMTLGATLVLNPNSPYGKEFLPQEVENLLHGGIGQPADQRVVQKDTQVLLGQPASYPHQMVASLGGLFVKHRGVRRGYLAMMHDPEQDEHPHLIVGIEIDGEADQVLREAGAVAADSAPQGEPVDLVRVDPADTGLSAYFIKQTEPFYERPAAPPSAPPRKVFGKRTPQ